MKALISSVACRARVSRRGAWCVVREDDGSVCVCVCGGGASSM
jgi:hypothetical protein